MNNNKIQKIRNEIDEVQKEIQQVRNEIDELSPDVLINTSLIKTRILNLKYSSLTYLGSIVLIAILSVILCIATLSFTNLLLFLLTIPGLLVIGFNRAEIKKLKKELKNQQSSPELNSKMEKLTDLKELEVYLCNTLKKELEKQNKTSKNQINKSNNTNQVEADENSYDL